MIKTMKNCGIIVLLGLCLILGGSCYAQTQYSTTISKMENSLFGIDYSNQPDEARLKRIEEVVYGQSSSASVAQRVSKLSKDLSADVIGQEIKPKRDTFQEDEDSVKDDVAGTPKEDTPKADSSVNYPIVNDLENVVFNKEFKNVDINQRLANLEQKVFKKTYGDDLSSRVDRLKMAVMPEQIAKHDSSDDEEYSTGAADDIPTIQPQEYDYSASGSNNVFNGMNNPIVPYYNSRNAIGRNYQGNPNVLMPLAAIERSVLRKSFPDDTTNNRLTRLELALFNSTFVDDDEQTRIDRLTSAYQAKKTSRKYDGNKFSQHMSTAVQIGAILLMVLAAIL